MIFKGTCSHTAHIIAEFPRLETDVHFNAGKARKQNGNESQMLVAMLSIKIFGV